MTQVGVPQIDLDDVLLCIRSSVQKAQSEEDVRVRVSWCIEEKILKALGLERSAGKYEYTLVSGARVDALYGHVIIEYKAPGKLSSARDVAKAKEQVVRYITEEAGSKSEWPRYLGVIISDRIAFVKYDPRSGDWILRGPYDIRREVVIKLIEALRGLRRKNLDVNNLVRDFGPNSPIAMKTIKLLYNKLRSSNTPRVKVLFDDWMRLFKQATGYDPGKLEELPKLAQEYGLAGEVDYDALLFAIHTYYALIMKLLAAEIAYLYGSGKFYSSYVARLDDAYSREGVDGIMQILRDLENGGVFRNLLNIENFLEGDYFSWYLEVLDKDLADAIAEIARRLSDYEVAAPQLEPEFARDLLKRLYQNLVPRDIRHNLGEYYTPDWLAELVLDEVGLDKLSKMGEEDPLKPLRIRVLDPACGSGTFLMLYLSRLRKYAEEHYLTDQLLSYILDNVVGYDLNPLAVLAARTNYLLAIADLLGYARGRVEIPIYLADSIMIERNSKLTGEVYILRSVVGEFQIPRGVVDKGLLPDVLAEVAQALRNRYTPKEFSERVKYRFRELGEDDVKVLAQLYEKLYELEKEGKDAVWISVLRNAFAPVLKGKFDYVVGNPPWVNWENLPETYREISKGLWVRYGLAEIKGKAGLGKVKRDLAMLFLARCFDLYLKEGGKLGFLLPFTVFKTQAGAGFRDFLVRKTRIHVVHDLVTLYPFEGAVNRTAAIVVEKVCSLSDINNGRCPQLGEVYKSNINGIKHIVWANRTKKPIPTNMPLEEVFKTTQRFEAVMAPLITNDPTSPWMQVTPRALEAIRKMVGRTQYYEAHEGVNVALNQVYFVKILEKLPDGKLRITNPPEQGQKKKVKQVEVAVEPDLVYPLIRGRDVEKWYVSFEDRYIIVPHDPRTAEPIAHDVMKVKYPNTWDYFIRFFEDLINRSGEPYKSQLRPYRQHGLKGEKLAPPFYYIFNVKHVFAPYKVVWKEVSARMQAGGFHVAVVELVESRYLGKKVAIPDHTVILIPLYDKDEAYYIAGILNSTIATVYGVYMVGGMLENMRIPKFDKCDPNHQKIVELSMRAHELAREIYGNGRRDLEGELRKVEEELDVAVAKLFGMDETELKELKKLLAVLSGEEITDEEEVVVPERPIVNVHNTSLQPDVGSYIEVDVVNPSGEEIVFTYELPWGKGSFSMVSGKYRIPTPPLKPGKYSGVLKWRWRGEEHSVDIVVEVAQPEGPRRRSTLFGSR
ncbi:Eco57I restriction-modification methylase domain-containing protein [Pyrobaculum sp.]